MNRVSDTMDKVSIQRICRDNFNNSVTAINTFLDVDFHQRIRTLNVKEEVKPFLDRYISEVKAKVSSFPVKILEERVLTIRNLVDPKLHCETSTQDLVNLLWLFFLRKLNSFYLLTTEISSISTDKEKLERFMEGLSHILNSRMVQVATLFKTYVEENNQDVTLSTPVVINGKMRFTMLSPQGGVVIHDSLPESLQKWIRTIMTPEEDRFIREILKNEDLQKVVQAKLLIISPELTMKINTILQNWETQEQSEYEKEVYQELVKIFKGTEHVLATISEKQNTVGIDCSSTLNELLTMLTNKTLTVDPYKSIALLLSSQFMSMDKMENLPYTGPELTMAMIMELLTSISNSSTNVQINLGENCKNLKKL